MTDALVIVVSEETGTVSISTRGQLERPVEVEKLKARLVEYYAQLETVPPPPAKEERPEEASAGRGR